MLLYFIFLIPKQELEKRNEEFEYVKKMSQFYKKWIEDKFSVRLDIACDQMISHKTGFLRKLDVSNLLEDHRNRGKDIFHFYLSHFKPLWTDCNCDGYYGENFGMVFWQKPQNPQDVLFLAQKNCTAVSHVLAHEFLRQKKQKKHTELIHEIWSKHLFDSLPFEMYDENFNTTLNSPYFMTINTSKFWS